VLFRSIVENREAEQKIMQDHWKKQSEANEKRIAEVKKRDDEKKAKLAKEIEEAGSKEKHDAMIERAARKHVIGDVIDGT